MNATEYTLVLIKSDAMEKELVSLIQGELERVGLRIVYVTMIIFDMNLLQEFYNIPEIKYPHDMVEQYLCARPLPIWIIEGERSIDKMAGIKNVLRSKYRATGLKNLFHCPVSSDEFDWQYRLLKQRGIINESALKQKSC